MKNYKVIYEQLLNNVYTKTVSFEHISDNQSKQVRDEVLSTLASTITMNSGILKNDKDIMSSGLCIRIGLMHNPKYDENQPYRIYWQPTVAFYRTKESKIRFAHSRYHDKTLSGFCEALSDENIGDHYLPKSLMRSVDDTFDLQQFKQELQLGDEYTAGYLLSQYDENGYCTLSIQQSIDPSQKENFIGVVYFKTTDSGQANQELSEFQHCLNTGYYTAYSYVIGSNNGNLIMQCWATNNQRLIDKSETAFINFIKQAFV